LKSDGKIISKDKFAFEGVYLKSSHPNPINPNPATKVEDPRTLLLATFSEEKKQTPSKDMSRR
jgi:hypothetical protein